jgi:hypothetical protein
MEFSGARPAVKPSSRRYAGHIYVLDLATGEPLWHVQVGSEPIEADPALGSCRGDGLPDILIADHAFRLTAFSSSGLLRNKHLQARAGRP